ncbi:MAG: CRISPR-associated protein Cas6 [Porticoccaceae bacterium]|nr:MAG: CRISPR-associated protein Cas6 [Porticoccaceae bacterium]
MDTFSAMEKIDTLPIARYWITARALEPLAIPLFAGSMLRGAFGTALRAVSCLTGNQHCVECSFSSKCTFTMVFQQPPPLDHPLQRFSAVPNPYVIEPPEDAPLYLDKGETFRFSLVLMGRAIGRLALIFQALERALAKGLGKGRKKCELVAIHVEGDPHEPIYLPGRGPRTHRLACPSHDNPVGNQNAAIQFITPLRLQNNGRPLGPDELDARTFLIALARRYQLLCDTQLSSNRPQLDFKVLTDAARSIRMKSHMTWVDLFRYSRRQNRYIPCGGLLGTIELEGNLAPFTSLLSLGRWIHVGKETVFGHGKYRLV